MLRNTILALTMGMALLSAPLAADPGKAHSLDVAPGNIAWFDLTTSHMAQSKAFYSKLFGWEYGAVKGTDLAVVIQSAGTAIGHLRVAEGKISPFNGVVYVQVTDIVASSGKAKDAGGSVVPGFPFNLPDGSGAISLVLDPAGHPIGLFSRAPMKEAAAPAK